MKPYFVRSDPWQSFVINVETLLGGYVFIFSLFSRLEEYFSLLFFKEIITF